MHSRHLNQLLLKSLFILSVVGISVSHARVEDSYKLTGLVPELKFSALAKVIELRRPVFKDVVITSFGASYNPLIRWNPASFNIYHFDFTATVKNKKEEVSCEMRIDRDFYVDGNYILVLISVDRCESESFAFGRFETIFIQKSRLNVDLPLRKPRPGEGEQTISPEEIVRLTEEIQIKVSEVQEAHQEVREGYNRLPKRSLKTMSHAESLQALQLMSEIQTKISEVDRKHREMMDSYISLIESTTTTSQTIEEVQIKVLESEKAYKEMGNISAGMMTLINDNCTGFETASTTNDHYQLCFPR